MGKRESDRRLPGWRVPALAGAAAALLAGLICLSPFGERLELLSQDARFQFRGRRATHSRIVILPITADTIRHWQAEEPSSCGITAWGQHFAAAISRARQAGASWVGVDILFQALQAGPSLHAMQAAVGEGRVVLASQADGRTPMPELFYTRRAGEHVDTGLVYPLPPEADGSLRQAAVFARSGAFLLPSLPAALALRLRGHSLDDAAALRALARETDEKGGSIRINYLGPPGPRRRGGSFPYLSIERLIAGTLMPSERQQIRGAAVLLGFTDPLSNDLHRGPASAEYPGLEIHAHTLATLLDSRPLWRAPRWQEALLALVLGWGLAAALPFLPLARGMVLAAGIGLAWCGFAMAAFEGDRLWPAAGPLLSLALVGAAQGSVRAWQEGQRRQQLQDLFERYLTRGVAHLLLANPERLEHGGSVREATVLFMDVREYTRWAEHQSPKQVMDELNALMEAIVPLVETQTGWVVQYTGDGLLAVFGLPDPVEEHPQKAVAAAIGMVQASRRLSAARQRQGGAPLRIGCGIHTGEVAFGSRGGASRLEVSVVGDTVNVAARLEQLNKETAFNQGFVSELIISAQTRDRLNPRPPLRGPFQATIKGHAEPMTIYQVQVCDE